MLEVTSACGRVSGFILLLVSGFMVGLFQTGLCFTFDFDQLDAIAVSHHTELQLVWQKKALDSLLSFFVQAKCVNGRHLAVDFHGTRPAT